MRRLIAVLAAAVAALTLFCIAPASGADQPYRVSATSRIKDLANIEGVRQNQLIGYGLVVGLNGTGDTLNNIPFTKQSLQAMLERLGLNIRGAQIRTGNVGPVWLIPGKCPAEFAAHTASTRPSRHGPKIITRYFSDLIPRRAGMAFA